ncbi:MAG: thioesterase [Coprobacillus sp.]|nr:thioesterase [Coprobacillus sp.]
MKLDKFSQVYAITLNMVDRNDQLTPLTILDLFQDVAGRAVLPTSIEYHRMKERGLLWIITRTKIEIVNRCFNFGDDVIVTTWANPFEKFSSMRHEVVTTTKGEVIARGKFKWAVISTENRKLVSLDTLLEGDDIFDEEDALPGPLMAISVDESKLDHEYHFKVEPDVIDHNGHMNNTKYFAKVLDATGHEYDEVITSVETNYLKELSLGEEATIKWGKEENKITAVFILDGEIVTRILIKIGE